MRKIGLLILCLLSFPSISLAQAPTDQVPYFQFGPPAAVWMNSGPPLQQPMYPVYPPPIQSMLLAPVAQPAPPPGGGYERRPAMLPTVPPQAACPPDPSLPATGADFSGRASGASCVWASAEYVSWWVQGSRLPPLVTSSPAGTPMTNAGVLGAPGTAILYGDENVNGEMRPGGRFAFGGWVNDAHTFGLEAGLMLIGGRSSYFIAGSDGSQIISRPYVDATTGMEAAELVSFPGVLAGSVAVRSESDPMIIADALMRFALVQNSAGHVDFLLGYRYLYLAESLQIQENLTSLDPFALGTRIQVNDRFATRNEFNGGLLGLDSEWKWSIFSLQIFGKLALGNLNREVMIDGNTLVTTPGAAPVNNPGGLLALQSNSGTFSSNHFVCMPELGITAGCQITNNIRATVGYSLLWLTEMVRPGDQIDRTVNTNLLPPALPAAPIRPIFTLRDTDFWAQGVRVGLEFRF